MTFPDIRIQCDEYTQNRLTKRWRPCNRPAHGFLTMQHQGPDCQPKATALCTNHYLHANIALAGLITRLNTYGPSQCINCGQTVRTPADIGTITTI